MKAMFLLTSRQFVRGGARTWFTWICAVICTGPVSYTHLDVYKRQADVRDIRNRLLGLLLHVKSIDLSALAPHSVLVAPDLTPSMTVGLRAENVAAIVTQSGGRTSHSAILARALGIPAVLGVPNLMNALSDGDRVLVNLSLIHIFVILVNYTIKCNTLGE